MSARRFETPVVALLVGLATAAACSESAPTEVVLRAVVPPQGPDEATAAVTITGEGFRPRVLTDFSARAKSRVEDSWQASLGTVRLADVARLDEGTLRATVPAGLAPGLHDLTVVDPYGREVVLLESYRVVRSTAPLALVFATPPLTLQAGACSEAVTVEARDLLGRPALAQSPVVVTLNGSLPGTAFFSDAACTAATADVTIAAGRVSATLHFRSPTSGPLTVTALSLGLASATQAHTVLPNAPTSLAFATPPRTFAQGTCSGVTTLELQDALGNPVPAAAVVNASLQAVPSGAFGFFADPACTVAAPQAAINAGATAVDRYLLGVTAGTGAVIASAPGLNPATQQVTITGSGGGTGGGTGGGGGGSDGGADSGTGGGAGGGSGGGGGGASDGGCFGGGAPRCDAGSWRECDSFEAATIDSTWTEHTQNGTLSVTNACAYRGSRSIAVQLPAVNSGASVGANMDTSLGSLPTPPSTWFVRSYFYVPPPYPPYDLKLIKVFETVGANDGVVFRVGSAGLVEVQNPFDSPNSTVSTTLFPLGRWVCVELEVVVGNQGRLRAYIDGATVLDFAQRTSSPSPLTSVRIGQGGTNAGANSPARTFYFDDVVVSDTRVGCAN